ncbi:AsmA family protein [Rhodoferax sp. BAB1]|uniref:AsmA family protein n=1 Tax=Rhodoferax sp. BAB1 TaxID=2741720 RepID=UPI001575F079|nr:AsmA family protein [Rhodoferax sp. BAB1]QKO21695.1 AsmA family protein [Rhodoferax sp. BAB1]
MNKTLKALLIALAATVVLLLAVAAFIVATFNPNDYKPEIIKLVKEETGRTLSIPGEIRLTLFPRIGADLGQLSLSEPRSEQVFAAAQQVKVSVALLPLFSRKVEVDRVLVDGLSVKLLRDRQGRFNFDDLLSRGAPSAAPSGTPASTAPATLPLLNIGGITLSKASLDYRDAASGQQLTVSNLNFSTGPIAEGQKSRLDFSAGIQGTQPALALQLTLQSDFRPALAEQKVRFENLSFKLGGSAAGQRELQLKLGLAGVDASAHRIEATGLSLDLTAPNPAGGTLSLKAQGQASVDLAREAVQLALDGTLDSTTLALKAGVQKFAQPAIRFDLALGDLDADRYLPKGQPAAAPAAGAPAAGPEPVIDLAPLRGLDLNGALKVSSLKIMNLKAASIRLQLKAQGGRAELKPVTATLYGGGVNGNLYADAGGGQRLGAKLDLRGIQIGPLMKDALGQQPLEGRGNVALDLTTGGNTVSQFKQNLNGTAGVQLADGALNGIDIAGALRNVKAKLGGSAPQGQATAQQKTDFTEFIASLKISNGVARNDDLSAKTPLLRLGGAGNIYLAEDRLDYTVKATVVPTLQGQGGPELEQLKGLTIPVRLTGPYSAIAWKIDFGSVASQRKAELKQETQQKLDAKKEAAKEQLKDKAGDKLRNLLKR